MKTTKAANFSSKQYIKDRNVFKVPGSWDIPRQIIIYGESK